MVIYDLVEASTKLCTHKFQLFFSLKLQPEKQEQHLSCRLQHQANNELLLRICSWSFNQDGDYMTLAEASTDKYMLLFEASDDVLNNRLLHCICVVEFIQIAKLLCRFGFCLDCFFFSQRRTNLQFNVKAYPIMWFQQVQGSQQNLAGVSTTPTRNRASACRCRRVKIGVKACFLNKFASSDAVKASRTLTWTRFEIISI